MVKAKINWMIPLLLFLCSSLFAQLGKDAALLWPTPSTQNHMESSFQTFVLPNLTWVLEEQEKELTIDDLLEKNIKDARLINLSNDPFFKLKAHTSYWFNIHLSSSIDLDTFGIIFDLEGNGWPYEFTFKKVEAHIFDTNKKLRTAFSGTAYPFSKRDSPKKVNPSFVWAEIQQKDSIAVWVKLSMAESSQSKIEVKLQQKYLLDGPQQLNGHYGGHLLLNGVAISLLIISFFLFLGFRDPVYFWFFFFQLSICLTSFLNEFNNECYLLFFKENPRLLTYLNTLAALFRMVAIFQFARVYIKTSINFPRIDIILKWLLITLAFITVLGLAFRIFPLKYSDLWFAVRAFPLAMVFITLIGVLIYFLFSKNDFARVFSVGLLLPFVAIPLRLLFMNISDNPGDNVWTNLFINIWMLLTSTAILAYRFILITKEKEKANKEKIASNLEQLKQKQLAEQKTKEAARLEELDKIKSDFFSNITHEFRTPLTLIMGPLGQVIKHPDRPWLSRVKLAQNNSQKLLDLINQLLDISKLENNQMHLELSRKNIVDVINPLLNSFSFLAKEKNILFTYPQNKVIQHFDFDQDKIEKIVSNLISNAIKFTNQKGTIDIEFYEKEINHQIHFIFKITDTGIGISEKEQAQIFNRFFQVDGSNTRKYQGTGIGLSLCKELVKLMDGTIKLKSKRGEGSCFEVNIPMRFEKEEVNVLSYEPTTVQPINKKSPISKSEVDLDANNIALVIEDNDDLRQFIISSIDENYQVIEARNGKEGVDKALEYIPNIIISDVMMPGMNGFEACEKIKTNEKTAHIPIILLTAKTAIDSRIQGLEFGADAYMNKPFNTKELLIRMKNLIDVRVLLQQKFNQAIEGDIQGQAISDPSISVFDKQFLEQLNEFILQQMGEEELSIEDIAKAMAMSRTQLFRKLKALLNQSPSEFLRNIRLNKAKQLLVEKQGNVSEIAYQVGFSSQKYFSTKFKEKFGLSPSEI